jgi:hypothetical protein
MGERTGFDPAATEALSGFQRVFHFGKCRFDATGNKPRYADRFFRHTISLSFLCLLVPCLAGPALRVAPVLRQMVETQERKSAADVMVQKSALIVESASERSAAAFC